MTPTEKLLAVALGVASGAALAYIQKSKHIERLSKSCGNTSNGRNPITARFAQGGATNEPETANSENDDNLPVR